MQLARTTGALTDDGLRHPDVTPGVHARVSILRTPCLARWQSAVPQLTCRSTLRWVLVGGFFMILAMAVAHLAARRVIASCIPVAIRAALSQCPGPAVAAWRAYWPE